MTTPSPSTYLSKGDSVIDIVSFEGTYAVAFGELRKHCIKFGGYYDISELELAVLIDEYTDKGYIRGTNVPRWTPCTTHSFMELPAPIPGVRKYICNRCSATTTRGGN